jgi:carbon-monoxide dehydrogenase medium subunit
MAHHGQPGTAPFGWRAAAGWAVAATVGAALLWRTNPPSDLNGDSDYRKHLATVLTRRAVLKAAGV